VTSERKRILIVDDSSFIRAVAKAGLERTAGWEVLQAGSGRDALALAEAVDAILLDVVMPDVDGPTTFRLLQENEATRHVPVIFLTAREREEEIASLTSLGVAGLIPKPFNPGSLARQVEGLLGWT
jgi:CheY-like chemotaxis protein